MTNILNKNFFKNILTLGGYNYVAFFIQFVLSLLTARLLSPEEFGTVALITVFTGFIISFKNAGLAYLIIKSEYNFYYHFILNKLSHVIGLILALIVIILSYPISLFYENNTLLLPTLLIAVAVFLESLCVIPIAVLQKDLKFNILGKANIYSILVGSTVTIILAYIGFSYYAIIIGLWFNSTFQYFYFRFHTNLKAGNYKLYYILAGYKLSKGMILYISSSKIIQYWSNNTDTLIVGKFYSTVQLGIYNRAYQILTIQLNLIVSTFNVILLPTLKNIQKEGGNINMEFLKSMNLINFIILPISFILVCFPHQLVMILWGSSWSKVAQILPFFGVISNCYLLVNNLGCLYVLKNKENKIFSLNLYTFFTTVLILIFGSFHSLEDFVFYYCAGYINIIIPLTIYLSFYKSFDFEIKEICKFWIPKIASTNIILAGIVFNNFYLIYTGFSIISLHIFYSIDAKKIMHIIFKNEKKLKNGAFVTVK